MAINSIIRLAKAGGAVVIVFAVVLLVGRLRDDSSERIRQLEQDREQLRECVTRLTASRRVAQVDVLDQHVDGRGRAISLLRWQLIDANGVRGGLQTVETVGEQVYFEAMVIKFEPRFTEAGDTQRGTSVAFFRRIFGDQQAPSEGYEVGRFPPTTSGALQNVPLETALWRRFWEIVDNAQLAEQLGIRVAQIEAPAIRVKPGEIWEIRIDAAGGLNVKRIGSQERVADAFGGRN